MARLCLPVSAWPAADQRAWAKAVRPDDPFLRNPASRWIAATRRHVEEGIGTFAAWIRERHPPMTVDSIADFCTPPIVVAYVAETLQRVRPTTMRSRLVGLRRGLAVMYPEWDWRFLGEMAEQLSSDPDYVARRKRIRDPLELIAFGIRLMTQADTASTMSLIERAVLFRNGLTIAFLAWRPIRRRNLAGLVIGRHLVSQEDGWWLVIPGAETKTGQPIECPLPRELIPWLERYIAEYRPILAARASDKADAQDGYLWLSKQGTRLSPHTLGVTIGNLTEAAFGSRVNAHLFRSCAATAVAIHDPEHVRLSAALLGHRQLATTQRYYNLASIISVASRYQALLRHFR